jgi:hypothetical protein
MSEVRPVERGEAAAVISQNHYLKIFPTGWTRSYEVNGVYVVFSIPANKNLATFLFGNGVEIRELARLWAPDDHAPNALSRATALASRALRAEAPSVQALVSFADPNVGHHGGVYQAMSWIYTGQSSESRGYLGADGRIVSRRAFHSNSASRVPDLPMVKRVGKHRYTRPLTRHARRVLRHCPKPYPKTVSDG